ncbi:MAG: type II toxin-antitoxin system PemK/MazF family toxin [Candidatus Moduliflexus flocculans]|nr:type II toxin-antitoxin system PemK/MazF family toxin [Candidatus Moduliflexus flocculans]
MVILQGDVFWFDPGTPRGSEPGFRRPHVVVQNDAFNSSRIHERPFSAPSPRTREGPRPPGTFSSKRAKPNLPRPSVVNVSQIVTVDKSLLMEKIGTLSRRRVREIADGLRKVLEPREVPPGKDPGKGPHKND